MTKSIQKTAVNLHSPAPPPALIDPVSTIEMAEAASEKRIDDRSKRVAESETPFLRAWRKRHGRPDVRDDNRTALCLSGGGIRSATFSLGVMQALAHFGILKKFDYISTVSGGGYIGSSLQWFWSRDEDPEGDVSTYSRFGVGQEDFPYGTEPIQSHDRHKHAGEVHDTVLQRVLLEYLRNHGAYLTPGQGIGMLSLIAVMLRAMAVTLVVWFLAGTAALYPLVATDLQDWDFSRTLQLGLWVIALLAADFGVYAMASRLSGGSDFAYRMRRWHERMAARLILGALALVAIGIIPWVHDQIGHVVGAGSAVTGAGALSAILYFIRSGAGDQTVRQGDEKKKPRISIGSLAPFAAGFMLYGILLEAYLFAGWLNEVTAPNPELVALSDALLYDLSDHSYVWVPFLLIVIATFIGWVVNLNYISIHRYYRDRLMETFMPDVVRAVDGTTGPATRANTYLLSQLDSARPAGPYPIINANVILVGDLSRVRRVRGGDSFVLSPIYCGSAATGWRRTNDFMGNRLTLASAMAISGAAASPNAGVGGVGVTRNKMVSFLMTLLNLRLGFWAPNPGRQRQTGLVPQHFDPGLQAVIPGGHSSDRRYVELSDGGHFENLGVYEMIRRRAKLIVSVDAGADPSFGFADLQNMAQKIQEDFDTRLKFDEREGPGSLIPDVGLSDDFPKQTALSRRGFIIATIQYPDDTEGTFVYLKSTVVRGLGLAIRGYKNANRDFPDESTANQFFSPLQVEAYRRLGYELGERMIEEGKLAKLLAKAET